MNYFVDGYEVYVGKYNNIEIDFVAIKPNERVYYQVTRSMLDEKVENREKNALLAIKDNYKKVILTMDRVKDKNIDGMVDIMVRDEDAPRINRIVERFKLITIDTAQVQTIVQKSMDDRKEQRSHDKGVQTKTKEEMLEDVLSQKPIQKENNQVENFNSAMTAKSPQSELSSNKAEGVAKPLNRKKSVRKELAEIKEEVRKEAEKKSLVKEVAPKVKAPKGKETR